MSRKEHNDNIVVHEPVTFDGGRLASESRASRTLRFVYASSPRTVLGYTELACIAADLNERRAESLCEITPARLMRKVRRKYAFAAEFLAASLAPKSAAFEDFTLDEERGSPDQTNGSRPVAIPDATVRRAAYAKLRQACDALRKTERLLKSEEIALFCTYDPKPARALRREIVRAARLMRGGWGTKRGYPALRQIVLDLHRDIFDLTGDWQRGDRIEDAQDEFLTSILCRLTRPLVPDSISDSGIRRVINTAIRQPHQI
ncbi:hypothetical protein QKW60_10585 [Defluviimonas aestuarii]|uniref:hypothetical protein n=1 Tax=Albidovulum aestuarii TaxID=1130726 RepID=UPI002499C40D|nr:hypothetical protein [Defluviimonas aestuarii]MDI3336857.1 hypothetical protein [Defluviimonas aestuarii]